MLIRSLRPSAMRWIPTVTALALQRPLDSSISTRSSSSTMRWASTTSVMEELETLEGQWEDVLPMDKGSHNSVKVLVPSDDESDLFAKDTFATRLEATLTACRELGKSALWIHVPMSRASLIEDMSRIPGLEFHHAHGSTAVLNLWLRDDVESKIPEFATHNVGVGSVVVNSRNEILCVRELRRNYMPWKTPTGLSELGESLDVTAEREVLEETGIRAKFHSLLGFRQTHGLAHGRSDMFFVARLDPIEEVDENGMAIIPEPTPQANEIEKAEWVPLDEFRAMVHGDGQDNPGHPMMSHVMNVFDAGKRIEQTVVQSIVPGRQPNSIYYPAHNDDDDD